MKLEIEFNDAIANDIIKSISTEVKRSAAIKNSGKLVEFKETDVELVQKYLANHAVSVHKRWVQIMAAKEIDDKINGNNIPG